MKFRDYMKEQYRTGALARDPMLQAVLEESGLRYQPELFDRLIKRSARKSGLDYTLMAMRDAAREAKEAALEAPKLVTKIRF